jgi:predicted TIM-barrel fold metal-dependent hydrolase
VRRGGIELLALQQPLPARPSGVAIEIRPPGAGEDLVIDHCDVWQPELPEIGSIADGHVYYGQTNAEDELLTAPAGDAFLATLSRQRVDSAVLVPFGATPTLDTFAQIVTFSQSAPGRFYPFARVGDGTIARFDESWRSGQLFGVKIHLGVESIPPDETLAWLAERALPLMIHARSMADIDQIVARTLSKSSVPVMLSHFGGYPVDRARYARAIELLGEHQSLYLITSMVWLSSTLAAAITAHPGRILYGSDWPAADPLVAQEAIRSLDVPGWTKRLVLGETLRFLAERVIMRRIQLATEEPPRRVSEAEGFRSRA